MASRHPREERPVRLAASVQRQGVIPPDLLVAIGVQESSGQLRSATAASRCVAGETGASSAGTYGPVELEDAPRRKDRAPGAPGPRADRTRPRGRAARRPPTRGPCSRTMLDPPRAKRVRGRSAGPARLRPVRAQGGPGDDVVNAPADIGPSLATWPRWSNASAARPMPRERRGKSKWLSLHDPATGRISTAPAGGSSV